MKRALMLIGGGILVATSVALGESAYKGWVARPDPMVTPSPTGLKVSMSGPFVDIRQPDPGTNCVFKGVVSVRESDTATVQRVYLLSPHESGVLESRDVKFTVANPKLAGVSQGEYSIHFETEKMAFRKDDVFALVLKLNDAMTVVYLRILYRAFEPS